MVLTILGDGEVRRCRSWAAGELSWLSGDELSISCSSAGVTESSRTDRGHREVAGDVLDATASARRQIDVALQLPFLHGTAAEWCDEAGDKLMCWTAGTLPSKRNLASNADSLGSLSAVAG